MGGKNKNLLGGGGGGGLGHMTKMATTPLYSKYPVKIFFSGTSGMQDQGFGPNKVCSKMILG